MKCPNTGRAVRRGQEGIRAEDKVQNGRVSNIQVEIHQPHNGTPGIKGVAVPMKYQLVQIIKRSIVVSVA